MPIVRLGHVNVRTVHFADTVAFYEALGLVRGPALTMADQERNAWMLAPDGAPCVHVNSADDVAPPAGPLDHVAFDADGRPRVEAALTAAGLAFDRRDFPDAGLVQLNLADPNGVKVELTFREPQRGSA